MGKEFGVEPDYPLRNGAVERRAKLFRETPAETLRRWTLGTVWALRPRRVTALPALGGLWLADLSRRRRDLPDPDQARDNPPGFCGFVHDLSVDTLVAAHRRGIFTFAHFGPLKWMSPPERCVLHFPDFHLSKRMRSRLRQQRFRVTFDRNFEEVIKACAARREGRWPVTWITPRIMRAYCDLHDAGYAHSFEVWDRQGALVGGGYGVAVGGAFTIESQFTRETHTSKIGFAMLNWHLAKWGFVLSDNKAPTQNVLDVGFKTISRAEFQGRLAEAMQTPDRLGPWQVETDLATVAAWQPEAEPRPQASSKRSTAAWTVSTTPIGALVEAVGTWIAERIVLAEATLAFI